MRQATRGQGGPAKAPSTTTQVDRELAELERRKMAALREGRIVLTAAGYLEIARRFPRHGRRRS
jgi:transposase-like protein